MLDEILSALEDLEDYSFDDLVQELAPEELRDLCKHRALIELLLALCRRL